MATDTHSATDSSSLIADFYNTQLLRYFQVSMIISHDERSASEFRSRFYHLRSDHYKRYQREKQYMDRNAQPAAWCFDVYIPGNYL